MNKMKQNRVLQKLFMLIIILLMTSCNRNHHIIMDKNFAQKKFYAIQYSTKYADIIGLGPYQNTNTRMNFSFNKNNILSLGTGSDIIKLSIEDIEKNNDSYFLSIDVDNFNQEYNKNLDSLKFLFAERANDTWLIKMNKDHSFFQDFDGYHLNSDRYNKGFIKKTDLDSTIIISYNPDYLEYDPPRKKIEKLPFYFKLKKKYNYILNYSPVRYVNTSKDNLKMKAEPYIKGNTLHEIRNNELLIINDTIKSDIMNGESGYWLKVTHKRITGYVFSSSLSESPSFDLGDELN